MHLKMAFILLIAVISSIITIFFNVKLTWHCLWKKWKKNRDLTLFQYRFVLDIVFGAMVSLYTTDIFLRFLFPVTLEPYEDAMLLISIPLSMLSAFRSIIALAIAVERVFSAYLPRFYRSVWRTGAENNSWLILPIAASFSLLQPIILFGFCHFDIQSDIPNECKALGCATNTCFHCYRMTSNSIVFFGISLLSAAVFLKILFWMWFGKKLEAHLCTANRLALLDTLTVLIFDFLPSFSAHQWPGAVSFVDYGPYVSVSKVTGCAIEAVVVSRILLRNPVIRITRVMP